MSTSVSRRSDKRRDLLEGALVVFAADGYARASIDGIARAAGVSSRTIYNQFGDKAGLFEAVIVDSARRVADAQVETAQRLLGGIVAGAEVDIEAELIVFARAWATPRPEFAPHFSLVRQVHAEAGHIPEAALRAWQKEGPQRVHRAVAGHLRRIADAGHLEIDDAQLATSHLILLVASEATNRSHHGAVPLPRREVHRLADAGVRAFLHGYRRGGGPERVLGLESRS